MTSITTHKLYKGKILIDYHEGDKFHWFTKHGEKERIDGVTSITGLLDKSTPLVIWATRLAKEHMLQYLENSAGKTFTLEELSPVIEEAVNKHRAAKEEAADIGTMVHDYAEAFGKAKLFGQELPPIKEDWDERVLNGVMAFLDWHNSENVKFVAAERIVYSKKHNYAGKMDALLEIDGRPVIGDYKTGKGLYNDHYYQLAGYWNAIEEEDEKKYPKGVILHFDKLTGAFKPYFIDRPDHEKNLAAFLGFRAAKIREKELAKHY